MPRPDDPPAPATVQELTTAPFPSGDSGSVGVIRPSPASWTVKGRRLHWQRRPWLMGILNVTPDSFSDGGQFLSIEQAVRQGRTLVADGADVIDVGGESTRPGATPVSVEEELARVVPVIAALAREVDVPLSIDTTKAEVAQAALDAGAVIVNDVSGLTFDSEMLRVCAASRAGVVCMHIQGTPQTMQLNPTYHDVVAEVCEWLADRLRVLGQAGIPPECVVLDPGIGFGKTAEHNLQLLSSVGRLRALGRPVCIGHSRKRFLKHVLGRPLDERLFGTLGVSVALAAQQADMIRVHDVAAHRDLLTAWRAIAERVPPSELHQPEV